MKSMMCTHLKLANESKSVETVTKSVETETNSVETIAKTVKSKPAKSVKTEKFHQ